MNLAKGMLIVPGMWPGSMSVCERKNNYKESNKERGMEKEGR
jgi:hypothetical protein